MKRILLMITLMGVTCAVYADGIKMYKSNDNPLLKLTGGYIQRPGVKQGEAAFINAQKAISSDEFASIASRLGKMLHITFAVKELTISTPKECDEAFKKETAQFVVFIIDNKSNDNTLAIFPDKRYAIVNINPLRADGGDGAYLISRAKKEAVRGFLYVAGGASTPAEGNLMSAFRSIRDLDKVPVDAFPVEVIGRVGEYLPKMGCETKAMVTYKRACQEGWAPQPTNDYQKAIWNQVHSIPDKPITIEFDSKKGK